HHLLVPGDLAIIVCMHIHPGWGHEEPICIDYPFGAAKVLSYCHDPTMSNRHISGERRFPGTIYNLSAANSYVMHQLSPFFALFLIIHGNLASYLERVKFPTFPIPIGKNRDLHRHRWRNTRLGLTRLPSVLKRVQAEGSDAYVIFKRATCSITKM